MDIYTVTSTMTCSEKAVNYFVRRKLDCPLSLGVGYRDSRPYPAKDQLSCSFPV